MLFAADPDDRIIGSIADFEDSVKRDDRFICPVNFLKGKVGFAKVLNAGSSDDFHVAWCAPVSIGYLVIFRVLIGVPTQPVENILEGMNHDFSSAVSVTGFSSTKPLLVRLRRV
jgi:hypothetical protein